MTPSFLRGRHSLRRQLVRKSPGRSGEEPIWLFDLSRDGQTEAFAAFVTAVGHTITRISRPDHPWEFLNDAFGYLVKGFFAEDVEQLLWHMVCIDALLGDAAPGATKRVGKRVAALWPGNERGETRRNFDVLYDLRSDLVHGKKFRRDAHQGHLRMAREIARTCAIGMTKVLETMSQEPAGVGASDEPRRDDILKMLELDGAERRRLIRTLTFMPDGNADSLE
jgi:hypothetical protein